MDVKQDLLPPWSLPDDPFSILADFDHAASVDLFSQFEPAAVYSDLESNDVAPVQASSETDNLMSNSLEAVVHKPAKAKEQAKELNRRAQKRHRDKQKSKWQRLEEELASSQAVVSKLQADNKHLSIRNSLLEKVSLLQGSEPLQVSRPAQVTCPAAACCILSQLSVSLLVSCIPLLFHPISGLHLFDSTPTLSAVATHNTPQQFFD